MMQTSLFDWQTRFEQLDDGGDPLAKLRDMMDWELFRPDLEKARDKDRLSNAGRKPFDVVLMFKILILQSLYNLSDDQTEFQIRDRLSFMRFLGLSLGDTVPDAKTLWLFRETLAETGLIDTTFERFDAYLRQHGFEARKGQIIDASIVPVPKQRNSRQDNQQIKEGQIPDYWSENKRRQKDTDARWVQKHGQNHYGYKNHIEVDVEHKLIRDYEVTPASVHDSRVFETLLDERNRSRDVWGDSAYSGKQEGLTKHGFRSHLQRKGYRYKKLTESQRRSNYRRARIRCRVEHVFGVQVQRAGNLLIRTIGLIRAKAKIGLRNLAYNLTRYRLLAVQA
jgi:IS5 family transposase